MSEVLNRITIITRPEKKEELRVMLKDLGIQGMTVSGCSGCGVQKASMRYYRGAVKEVRLLKKVMFEVVVPEDKTQIIIDAACELLRTGEIGDGKIFVEEELQAIKIRTNEQGINAL